MSPARPDDKILSYGDVVLRRSDLDILRGPNFVNDRLIEFFFSHLSATHPSAADNSGRLVLVPPSISFWLSNCLDAVSLREAAAPLRLHDRDLIIFTINDNYDVNLPEGGSHWSLLVYDRGEDVFVHHDSYGNTNLRYAWRLYESVKVFVGGDPRLRSGPMPQQRNGYDCGLYVMAASRVICDWFEKSKEEDGKGYTQLLEEVDEDAAVSLRLEMQRMIADLGGRG